MIRELENTLVCQLDFYIIPKRGLHTALYAGAPAPYWAPPAPFPLEPPIPLTPPRGPSRLRDAAPMARCASSASAVQTVAAAQTASIRAPTTTSGRTATT